MPRDARFWRNVAIIAVAHLAVLVALVRSKSEAARSNVQEIVWMSGGAAETVSSLPPPAVDTRDERTPQPTPDEEVQPPDVIPASSDIQLSTPTPTPTPRPSITPTPVPKVSPKPTAKPTPKATPKKTVVAKEPTSKKKPGEKKKEGTEGTKKEAPKIVAPGESKTERTGSSSSETKGNGTGSGTGKASEFHWYGDMLHDRFHKEWEQPKSIVATGAKMSVVVKIRIEKDGRVSSFTILKPSGNVVVDESVAAVAKRVTQVDPLPQGLSSRDYYEVNINFAFNADK